MKWKASMGENMLNQANTTIIKSDVIDKMGGADDEKPEQNPNAQFAITKDNRTKPKKPNTNVNNIGTHLERARMDQNTAEEEARQLAHERE